jgi:integrase
MTLRGAMVSSLALLGVPPNMNPIIEAMDHLKRMRVTAKSQSRERRITDEEIDQIVSYLRAKDLMVPTDVYVKLAIALPRRREELLTMRWDDYDEANSTILLRDTKNPNRVRDERVPVPQEAKDIIAKLHRVHEYMLPYKPESVSAAFQRCVRAIGLEDIRLHDLRHEGISRLFEAGLQIQEVALISGHVSWAALRRYTHIKPSSVLEKLNASKQATQKTTAQPQGT